ncbi:hypoxanthine/guanine phosphoribosyltransferase [Natronolimnohabitans innermongolicus]|uniref:Adenine phosphoribosyltransferase n=1 Tax=Natronolimnohabitans innermongolicus JCM 12255 TaxID=1227499 RepID=L9WPN4_9EURY|nr:hypoxanthine/guanine phosphoribosyltransferase [Natronolimnohabitans innermongolicus]ELY51166.1 adenine phosphoribosyltransferase [Natronolimnohabitans innermongolicus JCM 12255]
MDSNLEPLARSLRDAPVVDRDGYEYFVHGVTDGIPPLEPAVLEAVADGIRDRIDLEGVDKLVAPEAMGIHHGTALSIATGIPLVVVRKREYGFPEEVAVHQTTSYGEDELYLNGVDPGDRVVLVDDVLSSGGTIEAVCEALEAAEAEVSDIVVVLRRVDADHEDVSREVTNLLDVRVRDGALEVLDSE